MSIQIKPKSNPNQIHTFFFCSSFFLCLQGQPDLCCSCYLLQYCFSFFIHLHGQPEFGSCIFLQSCSSVSMANLSCLLVTTFSSLSFLSNSFSSPHFNLLRVARCSFSWSSVSHDLFFSSCSFLVILLALSFSRLILTLSFLCSSDSEALFALSFSFLSERFLFRPG